MHIYASIYLVIVLEINASTMPAFWGSHLLFLTIDLQKMLMAIKSPFISMEINDLNFQNGGKDGRL